MKNCENLVFIFDIDGTLIPKSTNCIDIKLLNLLRDLSTENKVILASARPMKGIKNIVKIPYLPFFDYVSLNGAYSIIDKKEYITNPLRKKEIQFLLKHFSTYNLWLYTKEEWFATTRNTKEYEIEFNAVKFEATPISQFQIEDKVYKVVLIIKSKDDLEVLESLDFNYSSSNYNYIEINSKNVNKASFIKYYNISKKIICSFGDGENDIPIFKISSLSIAMNNANQKLKSKSNYITTNNYYEGIVEGINFISSGN